MKGTTDLMRHRWATQKDKDIILGSVWEQLGNRSNPAAERAAYIATHGRAPEFTIEVLFVQPQHTDD